YLASSYYEQCAHGLSLLLVEKGLLTEEEIRTRMSELSKGDS
ncbi:MAG: nitrile hydratase subunit beta, partial [Gammaproteobacteria bacterium]|nr:nitrile hydratase subunit beta [Gammaproteobacteria bacterium]